MTRQEKARQLEAEAKQLRRAESDFWKEVAERADEVKEKLGMSDKWEEICQTYGAESEEDQKNLLTHLMSDKQVKYFCHYCKPEDDAASSER